MVLVLEGSLVALLRGPEEEQKEALRSAGEYEAEATHIFYGPDYDVIFFDRRKRRRRSGRK